MSSFDEPRDSAAAAAAAGQSNAGDSAAMEGGKRIEHEYGRLCAVCGDKALGYNFNALTCESCKAFFRRHALKTKEFKCPFTENCRITHITRRFCQKCRMDKCFSVGMKKESILTEEDLILKRQKVEQNRATKKKSKPIKQKATKIRKESVDSTSDDTSTSTPSIASGTSASSESPMWESDKNNMNPGGRKYPTADGMSPITAASVPNPYSTLENYDMDSSKTLDISKTSNPMPMQTFVMHNQDPSAVSPFSPIGLNIEKNFSSQINFNPNSSNVHVFEQEKGQPVLTNMDESTIIVKEMDKNKKYFEPPMPSKYTGFEDYLSNNVILASTLDEHISNVMYPECTLSSKPIDPRVNQINKNFPQSIPENISAQRKSKEFCSQDFSLTSKVVQNSEVISKLVRNPTVVAKIIKDESLLTKFMTNPEVIHKLLSDPEILQFVKENTRGQSINTTIQNTPENNVMETDSRQMTNPILTNLITSQSSEKRQRTVKIFQSEGIEANALEYILEKAISLEYSPRSNIPNIITLNCHESTRLSELVNANRALLEPIDDDVSNLINDSPNDKSGKKNHKLLDIINLSTVAIHRLIKMAKKITGFKTLCLDDQIALLKGGCIEMMIIRSAVNYDPEKDVWKIPHIQHKMANIKVDILKEAKGNLYAEHSKFVSTFDPQWRDENIIILLMTIALFSPERANLVHNDIVKLEQNSYYFLLKRYLQSAYAGCEARSIYLKLLQKMQELSTLSEKVVEVYLNVNTSNIEPLLKELFDMKC